MFVPFLLSVFYVCTFLLSFLLSVFYVCTFSIIYYLFYYLYFMFVLSTFSIICILSISVFYVCTYIFYTYIYCYVAIGEHWRRLFWSKVNISENCVFIFSLDFQLFPTFSEASFLADIFGPDGRICVKFWS